MSPGIIEQPQIWTQPMMNIVGGILFVMMGLTCGIFYKNFGCKTSDFYYKILNIRFSIKGYQVFLLASGIVFIICGLLNIIRSVRLG
jgi:hypothetical protein